METLRQVPDQARRIIRNVISECQKAVIGKTELIESLLIALLSEGNVLLEGVPGVAKTTIGKTFSYALGLEFRRVQGSSDILPADIVGPHVFDPKTGSFRLERGPVFSNILLIDEINRNTPKTNSAVLEAMEEKQVTIEGETEHLPLPFMVIATQSPIEFYGVFPLPEVLVDRFLFSLKVGYPSVQEEIEISNRSSFRNNGIKQITTSKEISYLIDLSRGVYVAPQVQKYIVNLVQATRQIDGVSSGASPRASIALSKAVRGRALVKGRMYTLPDDVKSLASDVLRHRIMLSSLERSQELSPEVIVRRLLEETAIPQRL